MLCRDSVARELVKCLSVMMGLLSFPQGCVDKYELDLYRGKGRSVYTAK